jgi:hypothetical protein
MAYEEGLTCITLIAGADLSGKQYYFVKLDGAGKAVVSTAAGAKVVGVLQNKPVSGAAATVAVLGKTKAIVGASVTAGDLIMTDSAGKCITAATTGSTIAGWAEVGGAADGVVATIILNPATGVV